MSLTAPAMPATTIEVTTVHAAEAVDVALTREFDDLVYGIAADLPIVVNGAVVGRRTVTYDHASLELARAAVAHHVPWKVDGIRATGHRLVIRPVLGEPIRERR